LKSIIYGEREGVINKLFVQKGNENREVIYWHLRVVNKCFGDELVIAAG